MQVTDLKIYLSLQLENCLGTAFSFPLSHLDAEARPGSEALDSQLDREVSGLAPAEAIIHTLHHHGAGWLAEVEMEAEAVNENHQTLFFVHHHRAQVQAVLARSIIHNEGGRGPGGS